MLGNQVWGGVGGGGGGGGYVPFSPIIIRLLPLACRCLHCLCISGAALDDAEHSLTDLDFRNQISNAPTPDSRSFTHDAVGRAVGKTDGYSTSTYRRMTRGNFKVRTVNLIHVKSHDHNFYMNMFMYTTPQRRISHERDQRGSLGKRWGRGNHLPDPSTTLHPKCKEYDSTIYEVQLDTCTSSS